MSFYSGSEGFYICERCGVLLPGDLMVWLNNGEIYCEECYEEICAEEEEEEYEDSCDVPFQQSLPSTLFSVADLPHSLFLSQLPPKQRDAFLNEFRAGRDPFRNDVLMAKTQGVKARNFNSVSFAVSEQAPSIITGIGFIAVRDGEITGRWREAIGPQKPFKTVWQQCMSKYDYGPVPFVSYNAEGDRRCLKATLKASGMDDPDTPFIDVLAHSRQYFRNKIQDFQLKTVAALCKYDLREQHNLLNEAEAIARIAMKAIPISNLL